MKIEFNTKEGNKMSKQPITRYTVGTITTKDIKLWERTKNLQANGETLESILRRGLESIEQESIDDLKQNNVS